MGMLVKRANRERSKVTVVSTSVASNTNNAATFSVPLPTGWQAGDVAIVFVSAYNMSMPSAPTNWTLLANDSTGTRQRLHVAHKTLALTDAATFNVTVTGTLDSAAASVILLRNVPSVGSPIYTSTAGGSTTATTAHTVPSTPTVTNTDQRGRAIRLGAVTTYISTSSGTVYPLSFGGKTKLVEFRGARPNDTTQAVIGIYMDTVPADGVLNSYAVTSSVSREYGAHSVIVRSA